MGNENSTKTYSSGCGPDLIVLGGGPGISSRIYRHYLRPLDKFFRCHFWDYRGTGNSAASTSYGFDEDYADLLNVLSNLKLKGQPISVLAHSYGGLLALRLAIDLAGAVRELLLVNAFAGFADCAQASLPLRQARLGKEDFAEYMRVMMTLKHADLDDQKKFLQFELRNQLQRLDSPFVTEFLSQLELSLPVQTTHSGWQALDFKSRLKALKMPVWITTSQNDVVVPPQSSRALAEAMGRPVREFLGAGHWPFAETPEIFFAELRKR